MKTSLKNVLNLIHMSDVTTAAVKSTRWHEDILRALQIIKRRREVMWCHVCSYRAFLSTIKSSVITTYCASK